MHPLEILREASRDCVSQKIPSLLLLMAALAATVASLLTAGQHAAAQAILAAQLESPSARLLVVRDSSGSLNTSVLQMVTETSGVEQAFGVFSIDDAEPTVGGIRIPVWTVTDVTVAYVQQEGRQPEAEEGLVDLSKLEYLGWEVPAGAVTVPTGTSYPVVGGGHPRAGFESLAGAVVVQSGSHGSIAGHGAQTRAAQIPNSKEKPLQSLYILADRLENLDKVKAATLSYISVENNPSVTVETAGLQIVNELTGGKYAQYGRLIIMTVFVFASVLTAIVSLTYVLLYRRALGRRRALGITRLDLAALTLTRIALAVISGVLIAGVLAAVISYLWFAPIPITHLLATCAAIACVSVLSATLPVAWAVTRDPVRVLRTA